MPDQRVPDWLLQRAQGIAVIPNVVKVALIAGGRGAKGVLMVRDQQGRWSNPVFLTLGGGSFGFQWGLEVSDVILVFTTRRSIEGVTGGKLTLGADASVAVGPIGRSVSGATDIGLAEVYSYSQSKGLFAGVAIDGTVLAIDHSANAAYYQRPGYWPPTSGGDCARAATEWPATARRAASAAEWRRWRRAGGTGPDRGHRSAGSCTAAGTAGQPRVGIRWRDDVPAQRPQATSLGRRRIACRRAAPRGVAGSWRRAPHRRCGNRRRGWPCPRR